MLFGFYVAVNNLMASGGDSQLCYFIFTVLLLKNMSKTCTHEAHSIETPSPAGPHLLVPRVKLL